MKRQPYTPGDRIRIVSGKHTGRTARIVRVAEPVVEATVDGDRTYQLVTASVRPIPKSIQQERKAA